ncbi:MAG: NAD(P)H-dependent oxidoreductase subunit E, partial [Clostridia bacterium]|nr:NAD(P)H-dependent oxidoreductase subunit E [Clostridia bacterium]
MIRTHVLVCGGTGCTANGSPKIRERFEVELKRHGLESEVQVVQTGCSGLCEQGPNVIIYPDATLYTHVGADDVSEIVSEHLLKGRPVHRLIYKGENPEAPTSINETPFYKAQMRVALRNCGVIDPEDIDEYIAVDGYVALGKALTEMTPQEVIDLLKASGLRGRGGAGFP